MLKRRLMMHKPKWKKVLIIWLGLTLFPQSAYGMMMNFTGDALEQGDESGRYMYLKR
jgi:hypothetical protein